MSKAAKNVLFVHIPKAGGTSLRKAILSTHSWDYNLFDYGPDAAHTSAIVRSCVYSGGSARVPIRSRIGEDSSMILAGHFPAAKYMDEFPDAKVVTFVRHPVGQVLSHFRHHVLHNGYKGSLESFCRNSQFRNLQTSYLASFPLQRMAFIGLLEYYAMDLILLSHILGVKLPYLHRNRLNSFGDIDPAPSDIAMIQSCNEHDMMLYASVLALRFGRAANRPTSPVA